MIDWTNADYAHGPTLAAWLRNGRIPDPLARKGEMAILGSNLRRWERGGRATIFTVDRWLTYLGYHLSDLPPELWRQGQPLGPKLAHDHQELVPA